MKRLILLVASFFVLFLFSPAQAQVADGDMTVDTVWTKEQSPIVINNEIYIKPGITLTIEPGVIVKLGLNGFFLSSGTIRAIGTDIDPIVFTSLKDDEYGGDTNGDGSASIPEPGDWWQIRPAAGSVTVMKHVRVFYAGRYEIYDQPAIDQYGGDFSGDRLLITKNKQGIRNQESKMVISNSSIWGNVDSKGSNMGLINVGAKSATIEAGNNWWGSQAGPCVWLSSYKPSCPDRPMISDKMNFSPWLLSDPNIPDPVIIIPGILGSWNIAGQWEMDPILHTYDNLWSALKQAGFEEGKTLFALPYNWRFSNAETADLLKNKIAEIRSICNCDRVDIIGHSMGGLAARAYIEGGNYRNDVDQMIFLGTPHSGSPKSYLTWEGGEAGTSLSEKIMKQIFGLEAKANGFENVFKYVRGLPIKSVEELLPVYGYLFRPNGDPVSSPKNIFLENLNQAVNLEKLNAVRIFNISADNGLNDTLEKIRVVERVFPDGRWEHGYPENFDSLFGDHGLMPGPGDGAVPALSNDHIASSTDFSLSSDHGRIVTDSQKLVVKLLTGKEPREEVREKLFKKVLLIRIFSPADFQIVSPAGKLLGKDFVSGGEINEIKDAFYSGFNDEVEFAVIPDPLEGEYQIKLQGTGTGEYKLSASYLDEAASAESVFAGNIFLNQSQSFDLDFSSGQPMGELELQPPTIPQIIERLDQMKAMGWISANFSKTWLSSTLNTLPKKLVSWDNWIGRINKSIAGISNYGFGPATRNRIINFLNQSVSSAASSRKNLINYYLNSFLQRLALAKKYQWINNEGYDELKITIEKLRQDLLD